MHPGTVKLLPKPSDTTIKLKSVIEQAVRAANPITKCWTLRFNNVTA